VEFYVRFAPLVDPAAVFGAAFEGETVPRERRSERVGVLRKRRRSEISSMPPWLNGLQRKRRQPARIEPRTGPSSRSACTAYSEQVG
jgi:hypothetical protein